MAYQEQPLGPARTGRPTKLGDFVYPTYAYQTPPEITSSQPTHVPIVIVGGGMVGLTAAIDIARKGVACILIDDNDTVSAGSRSIAQARRTMDIWSRLGCAEPMAKKGVSWNKGHTHYGRDCILSFEVFPEGGTRFPSFTSLAQYYVEHYLVEHAQTFPKLDLRWRNRLVQLTQDKDAVQLMIETPEGQYQLTADYVVAADGARSAVRHALGLEFKGNRLKDKFVIADVRIHANLPNERNYWFQSPFYDGNTVLRVPQSDNIWRIDWQIDPEADVDAELAPANVDKRLKRIFGDETQFTAEWVSTYTSEHRLMDSFRHERVLFVGDAAHQFSPFGGGRGGNSGVQDADNLAWKLCAVVTGKAKPALLDSYAQERRPIAVRNLIDSMKSTEFITPKSQHSLGLRNAVLRMASQVPFAKAYVNTGRFAVWPVLETSPLSQEDRDSFTPDARPGTPLLDCMLQDASGKQSWLSDLIGDDFCLVIYSDHAGFDAAQKKASNISNTVFPLRVISIAAQAQNGSLADTQSSFTKQYDTQPGTTYLFRPDQHVLARMRHCDMDAIIHAMRRALALEETRS